LKLLKILFLYEKVRECISWQLIRGQSPNKRGLHVHEDLVIGLRLITNEGASMSMRTW